MSIRFIERTLKGNKRSRKLDLVFDAAFYRERYKDQLNDLSPKAHFDIFGDARLYSPSPLFDASWYAYTYKLNLKSTSALFDYYCNEGVHHGHDPHPLFLVKYYEATSGMQRMDNPILNFIARVKSSMAPAISPSPFFWPSFYRRLNPDVTAAGIDPFTHYMTYGWREGRMPNPYFHPRWYLARYPDIASAGVEPLQHFISTGMYEGRQPHYLIDLAYYLAGAPDVVAAGVNPYRHYMEFGDREGRSAHPLFDPNFYGANRDLGEHAPFAHYVELGVKSNASPTPAFDAAYYKKMYPDEPSEPLMLFLLSPIGERRHFHPLLDGEYQRATAFNAAHGANPLVDYAQFRSHFNSADLRRGAATIPAPTRALVKQDHADLPNFTESTLISVVVPCYKSDLKYLADCINSICGQSYRNWELILVDDGSPGDVTWSFLDDLANRNPQIKALRLDENAGISEATNLGIMAAKGEYLAFVDHDDVLTPNALAVTVDTFLRTKADVVYSDQAYLSASGVVEDRMFKPDWSPTLFDGVMFVGHLLVVRKSIAIAAGLFRSEFNSCQDYEFMLRVSELTAKIEHIPQILYHWRRAEGSVAANSDAKGKIEPKQAKAVNDHFKRVGFLGEAKPDYRVPHRLQIRPIEVQREPPLVDVVWSGSGEVADTFRHHLAKVGIEIREFSVTGWSASPKSCVNKGNSPWVLFLSEGLRFVNDKWLDHLLMYAGLGDIAFAAPHLYDNHGRVVSAGLVISSKAELLASYVGRKEGTDGAIGTLLCDREVSAIGATCALVQRSKIDVLGGVSEIFTGSDGAVADLAYRATLSGYRNISVATKLVEVLESHSPNALQRELDRQFFKDRHSAEAPIRDRYYNCNYIDGRANFDMGF